MVGQECKRAMYTCVICASIPTLLLWMLADGMSKNPVGARLWFVAALVGISVGFASGLLTCVFVLALARDLRAEGTNQPDTAGATIANNQRGFKAVRWLFGVTLALLGVILSLAWCLDPIAVAMSRKY